MAKPMNQQAYTDAMANQQTANDKLNSKTSWLTSDDQGNVSNRYSTNDLKAMGLTNLRDRRAARQLMRNQRTQYNAAQKAANNANSWAALQELGGTDVQGYNDNYDANYNAENFVPGQRNFAMERYQSSLSTNPGAFTGSQADFDRFNAATARGEQWGDAQRAAYDQNSMATFNQNRFTNDNNTYFTRDGKNYVIGNDGNFQELLAPTENGWQSEYGTTYDPTAGLTTGNFTDLQGYKDALAAAGTGNQTFDYGGLTFQNTNYVAPVNKSVVTNPEGASYNNYGYNTSNIQDLQRFLGVNADGKFGQVSTNAMKAKGYNSIQQAMAAMLKNQQYPVYNTHWGTFNTSPMGSNGLLFTPTPEQKAAAQTRQQTTPTTTTPTKNANQSDTFWMRLFNGEYF